MEIIKVLIVDDHSLVRSCLAKLLSGKENIELVGTADNGADAYNQIMEIMPDIVLLDISLSKGESGIITLKKIKEDFNNINVIMLTMHDDSEIILNAIMNGASGYITKTAIVDELVRGIEKVHSGEKFFIDSAKYIYFEYKKTSKKKHIMPTNLSARELEVLSYVAQGYTNKELSIMFQLSVSTIESHQKNIRAKIGANSRADLVKFAIKKGLLNA